MVITPRNWKSFQHYTDRKPAWVKLHRDLLDNFEFHCLPVASRALAPMLWLLASESEDGSIDATAAKLAFRLRMSPKEVEEALKPLIAVKFFEVVQSASEVLAEVERNGVSERETEREIDAGPKPASKTGKPRKTRIPENLTLDDSLAQYVTTTLPDADPRLLFDQFSAQAKAKGWEYVDWRSAFQTYARNAKPGSGHFSAGVYPRKGSNDSLAGVRFS